MRKKSPQNRRNTVSLPIWCDTIKQEDYDDERRQSINDLNAFCHLTREQLIQRVIQLEKEKQLSACSHIGKYYFIFNMLLLSPPPWTYPNAVNQVPFLPSWVLPQA